MEMTAEEYKSRSREYEMDEARKGLIAHGAVISAVSVGLTALNLAFTPQFPWCIFPILGMSVGVAIHYLLGVRLGPKFLEDKERRIENWR